MSRKATQCQKILAFIDEFGGITPSDAMMEIGCMRLAARINDLEKAGHRFIHEMVTREGQYGTVRYMRYRKEV